MAAQNPQPPTGAIAPGTPPPPPPPPPPEPAKREIRIVSHCALFYWWPVWLVGFILWIVTSAPHVVGKGDFLVTVPNGTSAIKKAYTDEKTGKLRDAYVLPEGKSLEVEHDQPRQPRLHISRDKNLGVVFVGILLLVIVITNIPLRGLWSLVVIILIFSIVILFALLDWWTTILDWFHFLDIRINAAGYFVISAVLFVLWLVVMLVFDRQIYMIVTPGQVRVRQEIGDAEMTFDTTGMSVQKQRSDLFRHWILGLGSGDLIVKTSGANAQEIHMPNVLFVGRKVAEIEEMLAERAVVPGAPRING
ncbi:MAG TPA: hypothetical protein VFE62_27200 [Gemmataceae bacterium]|nr:hypothetical protein [Gemmataceae bacterium]